MAKQKLRRIERQLSDAQRQRLAQIRAAAERDFPPKSSKQRPTVPGIPAAIRAARQTQRLTWYALAQRAGIPNQATIRDIEQGKDVKLSNLQAVAHALGLELELVRAAAAR
jgi:ribosome-binding protein aMBF1 (putative translation factor)